MTGVDSLTLVENKSNQYRMNFNHPTKELIWVFQRQVNAPTGGGNVATNDWFNFSTSDPGEVEPTPYTGDLMDPGRGACNILLNGRERFSVRSALYFRLVQPYEFHTRIPSKHIYVYSFGLRPEEHQPSGTCNFSRIDNAQLVYRLADNAQCPPYHNTTSPYGDVFSSTANGTLTVYAVNYNVLRIMSGIFHATVVQAMARLKTSSSGKLLRALLSSYAWKLAITNTGNSSSHIYSLKIGQSRCENLKTLCQVNGSAVETERMFA